MILKYLISFRQSKQLGFGVGVLSVPAYPLRCRGGLNGGEVKKGLGFCAQSRSGYKKPQAPKPCVLASAVALLVTGLAGLLPSAPSLSASNETCKLGASVFFAVASLFDPCSRLESLTRLSPHASTTCEEKGRGTGVSQALRSFARHSVVLMTRASSRLAHGLVASLPRH